MCLFERYGAVQWMGETGCLVQQQDGGGGYRGGCNAANELLGCLG